jgi:hypothetical protein
LRKLRLGTLLALLALAGGTAGDAAAHEVTLLGTDMDVGVLDYNGTVWTIELKGRINCSGANATYMGITVEMITQRTFRGGAALVAQPPPNEWQVTTAMVPPGLYQVRFGTAICQDTGPVPEGHTGDHGDAVTQPPTALLNLPDCERRAGAALRSPLIPLHGEESDMRAPCPARPCDVLGSASSLLPLIPVSAGGPPVPVPCRTITVRQPNVPLDVVCGPGAVASRPQPVIPVRRATCRGAVELVSASPGVAGAAASRVLGAKRFGMRRGTLKSVSVPLNARGRSLLRQTRVLRVRALVRSNQGRKKSRPFTVILGTRR